jgi:hypothetical protein
MVSRQINLKTIYQKGILLDYEFATYSQEELEDTKE